MRINSIPSFKAQFDDTQFHRKAYNEALNLDRVDEYKEAKESIAQSFPNGVISRYSYNDRDVFRVIPREPLEITIPKKEDSDAKHLNSLIGLHKILKQISSDNNY